MRDVGSRASPNTQSRSRLAPSRFVGVSAEGVMASVETTAVAMDKSPRNRSGAQHSVFAGRIYCPGQTSNLPPSRNRVKRGAQTTSRQWCRGLTHRLESLTLTKCRLRPSTMNNLSYPATAQKPISLTSVSSMVSQILPKIRRFQNLVTVGDDRQNQSSRKTVSRLSRTRSRGTLVIIVKRVGRLTTRTTPRRTRT